MTTKITDLRNAMINVQVEGTVHRKSELLTSTAKNKYFNFFLFDTEKDSIRVVAFKDNAEKWFPQIKNKECYRISKVSVSENNFQNNRQLQIVLTADCVITPISEVNVVPSSYSALSTVKEKPANCAVDIIGRIVKFEECKRNLSASGETKDVIILTIMDENAHVDLTFWEHLEIIRGIPNDELDKTVIGIENGIVNIYKGAFSINVSKGTIVHLNPINDEAEKLRNIVMGNTSLNISQISHSTSSGINQLYSPEKMVSSIKRELEDIEKKEERLKIRRIVLENELRIYEGQLKN